MFGALIEVMANITARSKSSTPKTYLQFSLNGASYASKNGFKYVTTSLNRYKECCTTYFWILKLLKQQS